MRIIRQQAAKPRVSKLEQKFDRAWINLLEAEGLHLSTAHVIALEYRFHPSRKWRFDFAWPSVKVAVEIQGGGFRRGKHTRGVGQQNDMDKLNEAQRLGWLVLQFGPSHLSSHRKARTVVRYVSEILSARANNALRITPDYIRTHPIKNRTETLTIIDDPQKAGYKSDHTGSEAYTGPLSKRSPKPPKPLRRTR